MQKNIVQKSCQEEKNRKKRLFFIIFFVDVNNFLYFCEVYE